MDFNMSITCLNNAHVVSSGCLADAVVYQTIHHGLLAKWHATETVSQDLSLKRSWKQSQQWIFVAEKMVFTSPF